MNFFGYFIFKIKRKPSNKKKKGRLYLGDLIPPFPLGRVRLFSSGVHFFFSFIFLILSTPYLDKWTWALISSATLQKYVKSLIFFLLILDIYWTASRRRVDARRREAVWNYFFNKIREFWNLILKNFSFSPKISAT